MNVFLNLRVVTRDRPGSPQWRWTMARLRGGIVMAAWAGLAALTACAGRPHPESLAPIRLPAHPEPRELTADQQIAQAVSRLTYGPTPGEMSAVAREGLDPWLVRQLEPDRIDDHVADSVAALIPVSSMTVLALASALPPQDIFLRNLRRARGLPDTARITLTGVDSVEWKAINDRTNRAAQQILALKLARAAYSRRELLEVMTGFWENHFSVFAGKMPTRFTLLEYDRDVIRPHALGHFRDLLEAVARSPAMLWYLDNWESRSDSLHLSLTELHALEQARTRQQAERIRANARRRRQGLNENYGRELLELHTLGVDGGYTQMDVINAARALTGWTIDQPRLGGGFLFRPEMHDAGPKVILGHVLKAGRGIEDGEELLDIVARHPSTARFVATKLVRYFVSDTAPRVLVTRAAATFLRTDGDIRAVLATIFTSPEFYSRAAYRAKVKTPYELVVSTLRATNAQPDTTPRMAQLPARLGQPMFGRLTPDGWPDDGEAWMNTGAILNRINFGMMAGTGRIPGIVLNRWPPADSLRRLPFAAQVDGVLAELLQGNASAETRAVLLTGRNPLAAGDSAVTGGMLRPTGAPRVSLGELVGLALGAPEFQRR